jgi:glycosyltransferase involved in cell wall biosynthesis
MKRPCVGFDAYFLEHPMTGMGQYATRLWQELLRRDDLDVRLLMPADAPATVQEMAGDHGVSVSVPGLRRMPAKLRKIWWEQSGIVTAARRASVDIVHVPYFAAPMRKPVPFVITIHDAIPLVLKDYAGGQMTRAYTRVVGRAARGAQLILTDSRHAASDVSRYLDIPPDRIVPILLAAGEEFTPANGAADEERIAAMRQRLGLLRPFVLNVGGFDRRKNLAALVEGYALARPDFSEDIDLVIVGSAHSDNSGLYPDIRPLIDRLGLNDSVRLTGFVSEQDKLDLYRAAAVFVYPSVYEGFGLNPLEAMACGTPVICSNRASLPEVVGAGGISIDPTADEIARALVTVLNDRDVQAALRQRGLQQAATMSWEATAEQAVAAYKRVLKLAN